MGVTAWMAVWLSRMATAWETEKGQRGQRDVSLIHTPPRPQNTTVTATALLSQLKNFTKLWSGCFFLFCFFGNIFSLWDGCQWLRHMDLTAMCGSVNIALMTFTALLFFDLIHCRSTKTCSLQPWHNSSCSTSSAVYKKDSQFFSHHYEIVWVPDNVFRQNGIFSIDHTCTHTHTHA